MIYKSRKRKLEEAIKETFTTFAGTALGSAQILMGREIDAQEPLCIRIHANSQTPTSDQTEPLLNFMVSGSITLQVPMDGYTRAQVDTLEGLIESYIEQDSDTIVSDLNSSSVDNFGCWEFQPGQSEDDIDDENRRYLSTYSFEAVVGHATY